MTSETNETKEYAGKGIAGTGLGLGIAGTALALMSGNNNGLLGGIFGGNRGPQQDFITKEEFDLNNKIMAKDGEIALLKADAYTNTKLLEVYNDINNKIEKVNAKIDCNKSIQDQFNTTQAVMNATTNSTIACVQGQVNQLYSLTKLSIPNSVVCPGWGNVSLYPSTAVTTLSA